MIIKITPEDLIKRGLWDYYVYYIVRNENNAIQLLEKNEEFVLSEEHAIAIGLLKVMETDNLIYRFNDYVSNYLINKSIKEDTAFLVRKEDFLMTVEKFKLKFPDYWKPNAVYQNSLKELNNYMVNFLTNISKLKTHLVLTKGKTNEYYKAKDIKKKLNFNN
jgi:hypothetical protein